MTMPPDIALAYLRELSTDYRAGVVLDAAGELLAGDTRLADAARTSVGAGATTLFEGTTDAGKVFGATTDALSIVLVTGPFALPSVAIRDVQSVLAGMGVKSAQGMPLQRIPHGSVAALLVAVD